MDAPSEIGFGDAAGAAALDIALFDFVSHETMHLPFNEEYLRTLAAAFPADRIIFSARAGHIANLAPRVADLANVALRACAPFEVPFGLSRHNPIGGRIAARRSLKAMRGAVAGLRLRLAVLMGVDSSLYGVMGHRWPSVSSAPLHMILHGQLGDAMVWRSRNPLNRAADLIAEIGKTLPAGISVVALELGVKEAIAEIAPANRAVITLEHPILTSEWSKPAPPADDALKIAFLGNARRSKGFETFARLARETDRSDLEFQSIGVAAPDTDHLDIARLTRKPSRESMSRGDYLAATRAIDLVCLPLHSRAYDFTASGTVADAVAALKPLVAFRNRTLDAIVARYGPIGWLVESEDEMFYLIQTLDRRAFADARSAWVANLRRMREARRPEALAPAYRALIAGPVDAI
jgi:glycosyltransferase involved in cell wall biosynthesis